MRTHLFIYPTGASLAVPDGVSVSILSVDPPTAAADVRSALEDSELEIVAFWDTRLGAVPWTMIGNFRDSLDDAWHPGSVLTGADEIDLLKHPRPLWIYRTEPPANVVGAINWRIDFSALFVRAGVLRTIDFDPTFETMPGMARDLGLRMIHAGAICRQHPELVDPQLEVSKSPSLVDHYRMSRKLVGLKWATYTLLRRISSAPFAMKSEVRAWRESARTSPMSLEWGVFERDLERVAVPERATVTVVLPTYGRYRYVAEVLDDLRAQSIAPIQILIADGNPPEERQPDVYERYADLPIEVLWHEEVGICSGRNACLARAKGDFIWFVDDDSRFDARNLEMHLRSLVAYGADVSVGPAYTKERSDLVPSQAQTMCGFMDCGTTLVRRALLAEVGGFDMEFNQHLAGEDNDLGIRFLRAGGLMLNNPHAKRFHYLAPVGGSRSKGSAHVFRRWSVRPRPVQSVYYLIHRHFEPAALVDALLQASVNIGFKRKGPATRLEKLRTLGEEILAIPLTAYRMSRSVALGRMMVERGPQIPTIESNGRPAVASNVR